MTMFTSLVACRGMAARTPPLAAGLIAALVLGPVFTGLPVAAAQSPVDVIRSRNEAVTGIINGAGDNIRDEIREQLKDVINGFIDFEEFSRRALGRYWGERTEQEQADFVSVFRQLVRNSSVRKLEVYQADRIEYAEPETRGEGVRVTTVAYKDEKSVEIVYLMHRVGSEWKAYDVVVDGASTTRNYRDSFYREIRGSSYQEMYAKLVRRLEQKP